MYQYQDWIIDVTWYFSSQVEFHESGLSEFPPESYRNYFSAKYDSLSDFHRTRFSAAMRYITNHIEELNTGNIAIAGEELGAVGRPLIKALYRIYAQCPDNMIDHDYPIDLVRKMASESDI